MKRALAFVALASAWNLGAAQDLVITNARILDGVGTTLERGSVVISNGRIVSISDGSASGSGDQIDATGMTVLPGLIDTHVHLIDRSATTMAEIDQQINETLPDEFEKFLEAGFTTILSTGDHTPKIFDVRRQLEEGKIVGPRLLAVGPVFTAIDGHPASTVCGSNSLCRLEAAEVGTPEEARDRVRKLAEAGADGIKAVFEERENVPKLSAEILAAIADEAAMHNLLSMVHIREGVHNEDARTAIQAGVDRMVHLNDWSPDVIELIRSSGVVVTTTMATWSESTPVRIAALAGHLRGATGLVDAGVPLAYGTDFYVKRPNAFASEILLLQATALNQVMSSEEVIKTLTSNAAQFLGRSDFGSLEPGKIADIVIVAGDPLSDILALGNVEVVIRDGRVVVDNR